MTKKSYNTIIADNQFLIVESLKELIQRYEDFHLKGVARRFEDLEMFLGEDIDLLITDFKFIDYHKFSRLKEIKSGFPQLQIVILTQQLTLNEINELNIMGVKNLILKSADEEEIKNALEAAVRNKKYYSDEILELLMDNTGGSAQKEITQLTPAEIEIVRHISNGMTTKEIAHKKNVSFHTVMSHRKNIFRKLHINSVSELVIYAIRAGIVEENDFII